MSADDTTSRAAYETDWTGRWHGRARGLERPASTEELAEVLARCARDGIPVTTAGGRTGLVGGAVPPEDGSALVLSTERITGLEVGDGVAIVGAGTTLGDLQRTAHAHDLEYGVDLAARDSATVGGTIATDAGGVHVVGHGTTGAQVVALEVVLADGTVLHTDAGLPKQALGPDLASLFIGSEGSFGVITGATMRLHASPRQLAVALVPVGGMAAALTVLERARGLPGLRAVEYAEQPVVDAAHVLVEIDGPVDSLAELDPTGSTEMRAADDAAGRARLWAQREGATERVAREAAERGRPVHKLDVAVPLARIAAFRAALDAVVPAADLRLWGHLAEGNLHVNVWGDDTESDETAADEGAIDARVLALVLAHGGVISSEHGIGRAKVDAFARAYPQRAALLRRLKDAYDPQWLLNPGVLVSR